MSRREIREKEEREKKEKKKQNKKKSKEKSSKKQNIFLKILKTFLKIILILLLIIVMALGIFIGWLGVTTNWDFSQMFKKGAKQAALVITGQSAEDLDKLDPIYCLIMGVSVDIDTKLTDTIILCAYYPKTQQASMLSIPRDTFIGTSESSAGGYDKINSLYSIGGPEKTVAAVEKITGIDIPNYVVIDTQSLIKVVDEIGGVYFDVPIDMNYDDKSQNLHIHLSKGYQLIDGKKAEQLLRFRHNTDGSSYPSEYGDNDIGRMKTQRNFIMETIKQTIKFKNVTKITDLINIAYEYVDTNADLNEVLKYAPAAIEFDVSSIQSETLPGTTANLGSQNLSFYKINKKETTSLVKEMFFFDTTLSSDEISISPSNLNVQVLNGCGDDDTIEKVVSLLKKAGYNIKSTGVTTISQSSRIINRTEKKQAVIDELTDVIGLNNVESGKDYSNCDFTIIIGQDFLNV